MCGQSGAALAGNAYQDGTDWYRYDITKPASVLYCYQNGTNNKLMLGTAPAGSGVINFTMNEVALAILFKFAVQVMGEAAKQVLEKANLSTTDITYLVPR